MTRRLFAVLLSIFWALPAYAQFGGFTGGGGGFGNDAASATNTYVIIGAPPPGLTEARSLAGTSPVTITDGGPGGSAAIGITNSAAGGLTGLTSTGPNGNVLTASGGVWISAPPSAPTPAQAIASFSAAGTAIVGFNKANSTGGSFTLTLPPAATTTGLTVEVKYTGTANSVIVDGDGAETIDGAANFTLSTINPNLTVLSDGTQYFIK